MYDDCGEARNTAASATSCGVPARPIGTGSTIALTALPMLAAAPGVRMMPQLSTFMRIPRRPYSAATVAATFTKAALAAPYATDIGLPVVPASDPTLTIVP